MNSKHKFSSVPYLFIPFLLTTGLMFFFANLATTESSAIEVQLETDFEINLIWESEESDMTTSIDWGDWDGDGDPDLAVGNVGQNRVYKNENGVMILAWSSILTDHTHSVDWGDWDNDNDLDLAIGNWGYNRIYTNNEGSLTLAYTFNISDNTREIEWGDWDTDGDLDLAVGNWGEQNRIYTNSIGSLSLAWLSSEIDQTTSVDWGDWDADGDLDLAVGNQEQVNRVYSNDGSDLILEWSTPYSDNTRSVAWGDGDGDGDLDLAIGNTDERNRVYENDNSSFLLWWLSPSIENTEEITWVDWNNDGLSSLAVANSGHPNQLFDYNNNGELVLSWASSTSYTSTSIDWGDWDNDNILEFSTGNWDQANQLYDFNNTNLFEKYQGYQWSAFFEEVTRVHWADLDNDGDLDLLTHGFDLLTIYSRIFENVEDQLIMRYYERYFSFYIPDRAFGDWDGDGDLELVENRPNGTFICQISIDLLCANTLFVEQSGVPLLSDWDGDGDPDLIISNQGVYIYSNDEGVPILTNYYAGINGAISAGDFDNDGDLDLAAGDSIYENDEGDLILYWSAIDVIGAPKWGDFDNDEDLDLVIGNSVYENDEGEFILLWSSQEQTSNLIDNSWGDYDRDGDLDLLITNFNDASRYQTSIYEYNNHNFYMVWEHDNSYLSTDSTVSTWIDFDRDGDLDLTVGGEVAEQLTLYSNTTLNSIYTEAPCSICSGVFGDFDNDGDYDVIINDNPVQVFENVNGQMILYWSSLPEVGGQVQWLDWDGDGNLDLRIADVIYHNVDGQFLEEWSINYTSVDWDWWADWDLDGDLDFVSQNYIYENVGNELQITQPITAWGGYSNVDWGDWDNDGDYDLVYRNNNGNIYVLENSGGAFDLVEIANGNPYISVLEWGDWDGDGDLDLGTGGVETPNLIYENVDGELQLFYVSPEILTWSYEIEWVDCDGDGDLDLFVSDVYNNYPIYHANHGDRFEYRLGHEVECYRNQIDWDGDGDLDSTVHNTLYENHSADIPYQADTTTRVQIIYPAGGYAPNFIPTKIHEDSPITITYSLIDKESNTAREVKGFFSADGSNWIEATPSTNTITTNLPTSPEGVIYEYYWEVDASGLMGTNNEVLFRLDIYQGYGGTGPFQYIRQSDISEPFRVRGTQIQVFKESVPLPGSTVYGSSDNANLLDVYTDIFKEPFLTNQYGYLEGFGIVDLGNELVAMLPVTTTEAYILYHTSALPTVDGLATYEVIAPGVQTLTVSADNALAVFDLDVSLEWDASEDSAFLDQLENDLERASQILYDLTNGQVALGNVRIFHNKENWNHAHIVIPASNNLRPSALLGGIVTTATHDIGVSGTITNAYIPGQIRMPPTWNRFGNPGGTLGEDWPRTLAHELAHFLLFVPDNYLGLTEGNLLTFIDCPGSAMTDPYIEAYSEFLTEAEWNDPAHTACQDTLAEQYLGRSDWQTINTFYPMFNHTRTLTGPNTLPLALTQIEVMPVNEPSLPLADPFFNLVDTAGNPAPIPVGQAEGYLFKGYDTLGDPTDDRLLYLGTPIGDLLQARGAAPGDRLCVHDNSQETPRLGCTTVGTTPSPISLHEIEDWSPEVVVNGVTSQTFQITVTNVNESELWVQLLPYYGEATPWISMTATSEGFTQTLSLNDPAFAGHVRIWVEGSNPYQEQIVEFIDFDDWGGRMAAWGGRMAAWGGRMAAWGGRMAAWGAPMMSSDGQVSIFPLDSIFGEGETVALQRLPNTPDLPSWLHPIGSAYEVSASDPISNSAILFRYLGREVESVYEAGLHVYFLPEGETEWVRLQTELDTYQNQASAAMPGAGQYALIATVEVAPGFVGDAWNLFGYPIQETRPISQALASIDGSYTAVATYDATQAEPWHTYYVTVTNPFTNLVNTLTHLEYTRAYWLYASEAITLYLGPETGQMTLNNELQLPPATYYGVITPDIGFDPTPGMTVTAWIENHLCGESVVVEVGGQLGYAIQVVSENQSGNPNGCGQAGRAVRFQIGPWIMNQDTVWDNHVAHFHSLYQPFSPISGLAIQSSSPTPLSFATSFTATAATGEEITYVWNLGDGSPLQSGQTISHTYQEMGLFTVTLTASNPASTVSTSILVDIYNIPPTATDDAYTLDEDTVLTVIAPGVLENDTDLNGDSLTTIVQQEPQQGSLTLNPDGSFVYTPTQHFYGIDSFIYLVDDGLDTDMASVTLTVNSINDPPLADAGDDLEVDEGTLLQFTGNFWDDSQQVTIHWDFGDGDTTTGTLTPTHTYHDNGTFLVTLTVTDTEGLASNDVLVVTVSNVPPSVEAGEDLVVVVGQEVIFSGSFDDPGEGDLHLIEWDFGDGNTSSATLTPTHIYQEVGIFTVTLTITDDDGGQATDSFIVTVQPNRIYLPVITK